MVQPPAESTQQRRLRYLQRADDASKRAETAENPELRRAYVDLAQSWVDLIHEIDAGRQR
jgi:hypothetical protein